MMLDNGLGTTTLDIMDDANFDAEQYVVSSDNSI